jgi:hypothetical protein
MDPRWLRVVYPLLYGAGIVILWKLVTLCRPAARGMILPWIAIVAGWVWCLFAAGGGLGLLLLRGPWPPTNGWFALASGVAACPFVGQQLRSFNFKISGWQQFAAAVLLVSLGRAALLVWPQPHPL